MAANRYLEGMKIQAASLQIGEAVLGWSGFNWKVFLDPTGVIGPAVELNRYLNQSDSSYITPGSQQQAAYWGQQRAASQSAAQSAAAARLQSGQQLQQALRAQQAANIAAMKAQLAASQASAAQQASMVPSAPPSLTQTDPTASGNPPSALSADSASDGGAPSIVGAEDDLAIVVKVHDISKQSAFGNLLLKGLPLPFLPSTSGLVYGKMRAEFAKNLADKGIVADVSVVSNAPSGKSSSSGLVMGMGLGAGAFALGSYLWKLWSKR